MTKATFRKTEEGRVVWAILANWVVVRLVSSGMTLPEWAAKGYALSAVGINKRNAIAELKPAIPLVHELYNKNGDSPNQHYGSWEAFWPILYNRLFYFFRRHNDLGRGKLVPAIAEWPGTVSEDGLTLVPPPVPPEAEAALNRLKENGDADDREARLRLINVLQRRVEDA